jgi:hypothetical protein
VKTVQTFLFVDQQSRKRFVPNRSNVPHVAWVDRRCLDFDENLAAPQSRAFDIDKR